MERFITILILLFAVLRCSAQLADGSQSILRIPLRQSIILSHDMVIFNASISLGSQPYEAGDYTRVIGGEGYTRLGRYVEAKRKRSLGIVLSAIGAPLFAAGIITAGYCIHEYSSYSSTRGQLNNVGYLYGAYAGFIAAAGGLTMSIVGPIQIVRGTHQMKKIKGTEELH